MMSGSRGTESEWEKSVKEPNDNSRNPSLNLNIPSSGPLVCITKFAVDSASGAVMGSVFGLGSGLLGRKGFKGSFENAASSAKTFALLSGIHGLVVCFMKLLRGKDDIINSGVAGCCTGIALSYPGTPQILLQNCATFGAFSCIMDGINKKQAVLANPSSELDSSLSLPVLPPFTLSLPDNIVVGFSQFCKSQQK
ncbi:Mitochondrial import inner membrane translocase subunit TIM22-2 [Zostera marina]|uniref:Mitochondrial import inner membrane translocase subunit TIM22-2 n=1 Tax=Zostera marina TaxID=29655 RepID=A0A0K9PQ63_ZOSMR|nr:Mitochondrial import inner membrane translocase subunit TIM22-2 [Zostera marina]